jgi:hypothetical protein
VHGMCTASSLYVIHYGLRKWESLPVKSSCKCFPAVAQSNHTNHPNGGHLTVDLVVAVVIALLKQGCLKLFPNSWLGQPCFIEVRALSGTHSMLGQLNAKSRRSAEEPVGQLHRPHMGVEGVIPERPSAGYRCRLNSDSYNRPRPKDALFAFLKEAGDSERREGRGILPLREGDTKGMVQWTWWRPTWMQGPVC